MFSNIDLLMLRYNAGVAEAAKELNSLLLPKQIDVAKLISTKVTVGNGIYHTIKGNEHLIVDSNVGRIYIVSALDYVVKSAQYKLTAKDKVTNKTVNLFEYGSLKIERVKYSERYIPMSGGGYPGVRFNNSYKDSIKVHIIIGAMLWGYDVLDAIGVHRTKEVHHKIGWSISKDNSAGNLVLLSRGKHEALHNM